MKRSLSIGTLVVVMCALPFVGEAKDDTRTRGFRKDATSKEHEPSLRKMSDLSFTEDTKKVFTLLGEIARLEATIKRLKKNKGEVGPAEDLLEEKKLALESIREKIKEDAELSQKTAKLTERLAERAKYRELGDFFSENADEFRGFTENLPKDRYHPYTAVRRDIKNAKSLQQLGKLMALLSGDAEDISEADFSWVKGVDSDLHTSLTDLQTKAKKVEEIRGIKGPAFGRADRELKFRQALNMAFTETQTKMDAIREDFQRGLKDVKEQDQTNAYNIHRSVALQFGATDVRKNEGVFKKAGCTGADYDEDQCIDALEDRIEKEKGAAKATYASSKEGAARDEALATGKVFRDEEDRPKEDRGECSDTGFLSTVGDVASTIGSGILGVGEFVGEHAGTIGQALFPALSAIAQYQYTKYGSSNERTQMFRGLAMATGLMLGQAEKLPKGMDKLVDPLALFKEDPISTQQLVDEQNAMLFDALTMGGNPNRKDGFPYGSHEQLNAILQGSLPTVPSLQTIPAGSLRVHHPNYFNFSQHAYNGFPPLGNTPVNGVALNANFGSQNPFSRGFNTGGSFNNSLPPSSGISFSNNVLGATRAQTAGVRDFADRMRSGVNPPTNSLASLIDSGTEASAQNAALTSSGNAIQDVLRRGTADPAYLENLRIQRDTALGEELNQISLLDSRVPDLVRKVRRFHTLTRHDEDGLLRTSGKKWSRNMDALTKALQELRQITQERAKHIESIAVLMRDPELYNKIKSVQPTAPQVGILNFFWRSAFAKPRAGKEKWVPNWKAILRKEHSKIQQEIRQNKKELSKLRPKLKKMVAMQTNGVHEVNMLVVHTEKYNMQSLALQARQNLVKLKKADKTLRTTTKIVPKDKPRIAKNIQRYRSVFRALSKEADECARQLHRVESLQFEKVKAYDAFLTEQMLGRQLLKDMK